MTEHPLRPLPGRLLRAVLGALVRNTAWVAAALGAWSLIVGLAPAPAAEHPGAGAPSVDRVASLVDRHDCWTAEDSGRRPRHAVVTLPGERPRVVPAHRGFEIWLDSRPGVLHAFCP